MKNLLLLFLKISSVLLSICYTEYSGYATDACYEEDSGYSENSSSEEWKRIYLATYPRSGNHWLRYLIEEATGIATSSVYRDMVPVHLEYPFPWDGYCAEGGYEGNCRYTTKKDLVLIKTHFPAVPTQLGDCYKPIFSIRIIRNPVDSCWSFFIHPFRDENYPKKVPRAFVIYFINSWKEFHEHWNLSKNCLTFRYEDILQHPKKHLIRIIKLLQYNTNNKDIDRAIEKYPPKNKELQHIDHFEKEDLELMRNELKYYLEYFGYQIP